MASNNIPNTSAGLDVIQQCYSSSDSESEPEQVEADSGIRETPQINMDSSSSSSSSSSEDEDEDDVGNDTSSHSESESSAEKRVTEVTGSNNPGKKTGAVRKNTNKQPENSYLNDVKNLPPVPDISSLNITEALEYLHVGHVANILDVLVTVESKPNMSAYNLDTLLFMDTIGTPLGYIDDVLGSVQQPIYVVRFNTRDDIMSRNVRVGQRVYSAPKSNYTKYVFLQQLLKFKGTDASWIDDTEVPPEFQDFSDDDDEVTNKQAAKKAIGDKRHSSSSTSSLERYKRFEQSMNIENDVNTRIHKIRDAVLSAKRHRNNRQQKSHCRLITQASSSCSFTNVTTMAAGTLNEIAPFNPSVPPPALATNIPRAVIQPTLIAPAFGPFAPCQPGPSFVSPPNTLGNMFPAPCPPNRPNAQNLPPWSAGPMVVCNPVVPPGAIPNPYLFNNASNSYRPMALPMNTMRVPGNGFSTGPPVRPPNFQLPPRVNVPYIRPARMQGTYQNVVGSTNMGTGNGGRYFDTADVRHPRYVYQADMWIPTQSQPPPWPYTMPYVNISIPPPNLQQPPPNIVGQQPPPPGLTPQPTTLLQAPTPPPPNVIRLAPATPTPARLICTMRPAPQMPIDHYRHQQHQGGGALQQIALIDNIPRTEHSPLPK